MDQHPKYTVFPASGELGRSGSMRLSGYHHLVCAAAECDMSSHQLSVSQTIRRGYAWAIVSMTVDVLRPITSCAPLEVSTWISGNRSPLNRRELQFFDNSGECFRASVFSTPVSMETHRIMRLGEEECGNVTGCPLIEDAVSRINHLPETSELFRREVFPSDIDALGHMNNCRYGALAYDALTDSERYALCHPFRYTINYRRQLMEGSTVIISRVTGEKGIFITGTAADSDKLSFAVQLELSDR